MTLFDNDPYCSVCCGRTDFRTPFCTCKLDTPLADEPKIYYCEQCLHLYGKIIEMEDDSCPNCDSGWKLNRGQARHVISMKLQHYRALAKKLGIR